ncbi:5-formyltetrahydrofolate cyclo-ligase [Paludibacterium yongneupense]|uniref:5-formyltetrahydrofolate cyclo-ligase n=1 Tax=Paludibacterium yongneupense TaxID=400061 RepID=UPI000418186D|nr:5-formyltetrahydrofolate cyclo-ligase [Paludibacterium yongneupense]
MTPDDKIALRRLIRRARAQLSPDQRRRAERRIAILAQRWLAPGRRIGLYLASASELDLSLLLAAAVRRRAEVYLPTIPARGRRLWFSRLEADARWYREPRYGLVECEGPVLRAESLDVLFMPLLGVDAEGFRLGQGGGYYDTSLAYCRRGRRRGPWLVGVGFDCQRVERVPREAWDARLDWLLTESGRQRFSSR